jgi:hypothetical protein
MFAFCRDQFTRELNKRGYCIVPLADASVHVREIVGRRGHNLFRFGDLTVLFESTQPVPMVVNGVSVAPLDVTETGVLDGGIGSLLVSRWLGSDKAELSGRLRRTRHFKLKIGNVEKEYLSLAEADAYFAEAKLLTHLPTVEQLMEVDGLYLITSVLKTPSMPLESFSGDVIGANLSATEIQLGVSGSLKVYSDDREGRRINFSSDAPVVFAFQAAKLLFDDGRYRSFSPEGGLTLMGGAQERSGSDEPRLVDEVTGIFVSFQ